MARDNIRDIIYRMLEKARASDNEFEAESFLDKANELMERYQISSAEVSPESDPVVKHDGVVFSAKSHDWFWNLYHAVGLYYGCDSVRESFYRDGGRLHYKMVLIGRESAIATTELMYEYLKLEVNRAGKRITEQLKAKGYRTLSPMARSRRVATSLIARIHRLIPPKQEARTGVAQEHALVTLDAVQALKAELYPNRLPAKKGRMRTTDQMSEDAAMAMNLNLQTKGARSRLKLGSGS